jgi:hypothetical protein
MPRRVEGALDDDDAAIRGQSDAFVAKRNDLALLPFAHDVYCPLWSGYAVLPRHPGWLPIRNTYRNPSTGNLCAPTRRSGTPRSVVLAR